MRECVIECACAYTSRCTSLLLPPSPSFSRPSLDLAHPWEHCIPATNVIFMGLLKGEPAWEGTSQARKRQFETMSWVWTWLDLLLRFELYRVRTTVPCRRNACSGLALVSWNMMDEGGPSPAAVLADTTAMEKAERGRQKGGQSIRESVQER